MRILVTGCAGFIGFHVCKSLIKKHYVLGIDNLNNYYDVELKKARLNILKRSKDFYFEDVDFAYGDNRIRLFFERHLPDMVIHLGAQAGVRHSLSHPRDYIDNNITGFLNILECCRRDRVKKLLYASSSSVYGHHVEMPFNETQACNIPANLYAVTKKCNEGMAYAYNRLYGINNIGLRFFTVYGEWGRPDMALFKFTKNIIEGKPIDVYNDGEMSRDFTYISDIVEGIESLIYYDDPANYPRVFNIGCGNPTKLMDFINEIELKLGRKAIINFMPLQAGDIKETFCDTSWLQEKTGYKPKTTIKKGISNFIDWYLKYYKIKL